MPVKNSLRRTKKTVTEVAYWKKIFGNGSVTVRRIGSAVIVEYYPDVFLYLRNINKLNHLHIVMIKNMYIL